MINQIIFKFVAIYIKYQLKVLRKKKYSELKDNVIKNIVK